MSRFGKQFIRKAKYTLFVKKLWFFMQLQLHILWKTLPLKSLFVQYAVCFDPSYMVKNQDESIRGFGLLRDRLRNLKQLLSSEYVEYRSGNKWKCGKFLSKLFSLHISRSLRYLTSFNRESTNSWILFFLINILSCLWYSGDNLHIVSWSVIDWKRI